MSCYNVSNRAYESMKRDREAMRRNRDEERRNRDDAEIGAMSQWNTVRQAGQACLA